jgi:hypothetical protein
VATLPKDKPGKVNHPNVVRRLFWFFDDWKQKNVSLKWREKNREQGDQIGRIFP